MKRVGILISGRGSNMVALARACQEGRVFAQVGIVISNDHEAPGLLKAKDLGLKTGVVERKGFSSKAKQEERILEAFKSEGIEVVCLAGFMQIVGPTLLGVYGGRMLNIHPSLLPAFPGLTPQARALDYGVKVSGCTVHFVDEGVDTGPIIIQAAVPVYDDDTEGALTERILQKEHEIYPLALDWVARGLLAVKGRRVVFKDGGAFKGFEPKGFCWPSPPKKG